MIIAAPGIADPLFESLIFPFSENVWARRGCVKQTERTDRKKIIPLSEKLIALQFLL